MATLDWIICPAIAVMEVVVGEVGCKVDVSGHVPRSTTTRCDAVSLPAHRPPHDGFRRREHGRPGGRPYGPFDAPIPDR